jgi:hypothetical protein
LESETLKLSPYWYDKKLWDNEIYDWRFDERLLKTEPKIIQALLNAGLTPFVPSTPLLPIDIDYIEIKDEPKQIK